MGAYTADALKAEARTARLAVPRLQKAFCQVKG